MAKGRTTAGIQTELSTEDSYLGEINVQQVQTGGWEPGYLTWGPHTYKVYAYEKHCEFVLKLQHGLTVTELDRWGNGDHRILALWPRGRAVPDRDEHSKRFWKSQYRGAIDSAERLYRKLSLREKALNKVAYFNDHLGKRTKYGPTIGNEPVHTDELEGHYLDLKWKSGGSEQRRVLLFNDPVPDEPDYVHIETIREALLGIR